MIKGNERDCICAKPNGKHKRYCDAYRLSEFFKKMASVKIGGGYGLCSRKKT